MNKFSEYCLGKNADDLRRIILENPDLPIVVLAGEESWDGDHSWTFCSYIFFKIEEILDCDFTDYNDCVFVSRESLLERIEDDLYDDYYNGPEEEYEAAIDRRLEELEPYWKKVIAIYATN